jgi:hypothetical protein
VGRDGGAPFDDFVAPGNEVLFRYDNIRESAIHHSPNLLEAFQAGSYWHSKVVREILMEKMRNSLDIVLILENSREFPDDLFVQFFLHEHSFPEWKLCYEVSDSACLPWIQLRQFL